MVLLKVICHFRYGQITFPGISFMFSRFLEQIQVCEYSPRPVDGLDTNDNNYNRLTEILY